MNKTASVSETRQQLSVFLNWIKDSQEDVVIQNRGTAEAVLIPIADYELLQEARERQRRQQAVAELRKIAQDIGARNSQLSQAEADDIANEVMAETIDNLRQQGKVNLQD